MVEKQLTSKERRKEIIELIKEIGLFNVNQAELSKKYNVTRQQIFKDMKKIKQNLKPIDLNEIRIELGTGFKNSIKTLHKIIINPADSKTKIMASKALADVSTKYTEFLEAHGYKEKIADKTEHFVFDSHDEALKKAKELLKNAK